MNKSAFTLPELLAVMAAMSVVMGLSGILLVQTFSFHRTNDRYADELRAANRLVADFRNDIRVYGKPEIFTKGETLLRWNNGTETVDYVAETGLFPDQIRVVRTARKDGKKFRGATYQLPERMALRFVEGRDADTGLVALNLWTSPLATEVPNLDDLNPFDRTMQPSSVGPRYAGNWRTIIARY